jgi:hypothetical protein
MIALASVERRMSIDDLRKKFLVDEDLDEERLGALITKLLPICVVDKKGVVRIKRSGLPGRALVKIVLVARLVAHKLDESIPDELDAASLAANTGMPKNQVAARAKEVADEGFADRTVRGNYRARLWKVGTFLDELAAQERGKNEHD